MKPTSTLTPLLTAAAIFSVSPAIAQTYETLVDSAEHYANKERFVEAAQYYKRALKASPGSPLNSKIFANLGLCQAQTGEFEEAIQSLDVALVREPESVPILTSRAKVLLMADRPEEALGDLDRALSIDSLALAPLSLHSRLMLLKGNYPEASKEYDKLLRFHPYDYDTLEGAAICKANCGQPKEAIELFAKALDVEKHVESYCGLISAQINAGDFKDADETLFAALQAYPRNGELYLLRGLLHNIHYRTHEADLDKQTAISLGIDRKVADQLIPPRGAKK